MCVFVCVCVLKAGTVVVVIISCCFEAFRAHVEMRGSTSVHIKYKKMCVCVVAVHGILNVLFHHESSPLTL